MNHLRKTKYLFEIKILFCGVGFFLCAYNPFYEHYWDHIEEDKE